MAVAGKVAITLATENNGQWSADVTYDRLVAVKHNNNLYISRKTVANVEPPNNEFWFLALEGFSGDDIEDIIDGTTQVGNAKLLDGKTATEVGASGARNLIPYPYYETTHIDNGITWTVNDDGIVTANGTATKLSQFYICLDKNLGLEQNKTYSLSGCPSGGTSSTYQLRVITNYQKENPQTAADRGNGVTFTTNDSYSVIRIMIDIFEGTTVNNLAFRPMLEVGSIAHDSVPYYFGGAEDSLTLDGHEAEYFAKNADLANYLQLTGGTVANATFGEALKVKRTTAFDSVTTYENSEGVLGYIGMGNTKKPIYTDATKANTYELLHTGNKPSGTYTGNGDATARTITINQNYVSSEGTLRIVGNTLMAIVTGNGAFVGNRDGTITYLRGTEAKYYNGILTLNTTNQALNLSGYTYYFGEL